MRDWLATSRARKAAAAGLAATVLLAAIALLDLGPCADELSEEEFVAQGDEICAAAHREFRELQRRSPRTPTEGAELTERLVEVAEEERDGIADLAEPESLSAQVDRYLDARERGIEKLRAGLAAAEEANPSAYERAQARLASTQLDRYAIAERIGFDVCSEPLVGRAELARQAEPPAPTDPNAPPEVDNPPE